MTTTIFLARFLGFVLVALGLFFLFRRKEWESAVKGLLKSNSLMVITGLLGTAGGLAIVIGYNTWSGWEIVISLLGAFLLLQGLARLFYPGIAERLLPDFKGPTASIVGLAAFGLGIFLFLMGYFYG